MPLAPQALLVAVAPERRGRWTFDDLVDSVHEALDLAKIRAVEPDMLIGRARRIRRRRSAIISRRLPAILLEFSGGRIATADFAARGRRGVRPDELTMPVALRASAVYNVTIGPRDRSAAGARLESAGRTPAQRRLRTQPARRGARSAVVPHASMAVRRIRGRRRRLADRRAPRVPLAQLDGYATGDVVVALRRADAARGRVEREAVPFDLVLHMQASRVLERMLRERDREARLRTTSDCFRSTMRNGVAGDDTPDARALFDAGRGIPVRRRTAGGRGTRRLARDRASPVFPASPTPKRNSSSRSGGARVMVRRDVHAAGRGVAGVAAGEARLSRSLAPLPGAARGSPRRPPRRRSGLARVRFLDTTPTAAPPPDTALSFFPSAIRFAGDAEPALLGDGEQQDRFRRGSTSIPTMSRGCCCRSSRCSSPTTGVRSRSSCGRARSRALPACSSPTCSASRRSCARPTAGARAIGSAGRCSASTATPRPTWDSCSRPRCGFACGQRRSSKCVSCATRWRTWCGRSSTVSRRRPREPFDPELGVRSRRTPATPAIAAYRLGQYVPANWRPFVPAHVPGSSRSIRLQRARMPAQAQFSRGAILDVPGALLHHRGGGSARRTQGHALVPALALDRWHDMAVDRARGAARPRRRSSGLAFDSIEEGARDGDMRAHARRRSTRSSFNAT